MAPSRSTPPTAQGRRWCFTLNNYTDEEVVAVKAWEDTTYLVVGFEVGEDEGTPHLQGYVVWKTNKRLGALKRLNARIHWELANGNNQQASLYCKKDGNFWEEGELPADRSLAGTREQSRWAEAFEAAKRGRFDDIPGDIRLRAYRTIKQVALDHLAAPPDNDEGVCGHWFWGAPGLGKSRRARHDFPGIFSKPINKWWDGYQGHEYVLLDDFAKSHAVLGHHLLIWSDRYSFIGETKGGALTLRPKALVVTSNFSPDEIWADEPETLAAIRRRFQVTHFVGPWTPPAAAAGE